MLISTIPTKYIERLEQEVDAALTISLEQARANAPVLTGALRSSIERIDRSSLDGEVTSAIIYAGVQEDRYGYYRRAFDSASDYLQSQGFIVQ